MRAGSDCCRANCMSAAARSTLARTARRCVAGAQASLERWLARAQSTSTDRMVSHRFPRREVTHHLDGARLHVHPALRLAPAAHASLGWRGQRRGGRWGPPVVCGAAPGRGSTTHGHRHRLLLLLLPLSAVSPQPRRNGTAGGGLRDAQRQQRRRSVSHRAGHSREVTWGRRGHGRDEHGQAQGHTQALCRHTTRGRRLAQGRAVWRCNAGRRRRIAELSVWSPSSCPWMRLRSNQGSMPKGQARAPSPRHDGRPSAACTACASAAGAPSTPVAEGK